MAPALIFCSPLAGASKACCWVHELDEDMCPSRTLHYNLALMSQEGKVAAVGVVRSDGRTSIVLKLHRPETKQNARNKLELVYQKHAPGWTAPGLEALDAFHVDKFSWQPPPPTDERVRKATAAAKEDGVGGLREQLPVLSGVDDGVLTDWIKGGLLQQVLSGYLDGLPALMDCPHELRRHHLEVPTAACLRCGEMSRLEWSCTKCQGHTDECRNGCICLGRWCFQCGLKIKEAVQDAENVAEGVAVIQAAAQRGGEEVFDLYEDADFGGWHSGERELVTESMLLGRRRLSATDLYELQVAFDGADSTEGPKHEESWMYGAESLELEVVHKSHMSQSRRVAFVLHRANKAGEPIMPDISSLPGFYRIFHDLFREDYHGTEGARNCQRVGLALFAEFTKNEGAACELNLKDLPVEVRCAVESVTRGTEVTRCQTCSKEIMAGMHCSQRCEGTCKCHVCRCGVEVVCDVCQQRSGRGRKRPADAEVTEILEPAALYPLRPRPTNIIPREPESGRDLLREFLAKHRDEGTEPDRSELPWFGMPWRKMLEQLEKMPNPERAVTREPSYDSRLPQPEMIPKDGDAYSDAVLRQVLAKHRDEGTEPAPAWFGMPWRKRLEQLEKAPPPVVEYVPNPLYVPPRMLISYKCNKCGDTLMPRNWQAKMRASCGSDFIDPLA